MQASEVFGEGIGNFVRWFGSVGRVGRASLDRQLPEERFPSPVRMFACVAALAILAIPRAGGAQSIDVKDAWLKRNCMDKGTADHPTSAKEFEACVRKQIEGMPRLDPNHREHFGEQYEPVKYVECRTRPGNRNNSACNVYILRRREWPEYWPEGAKRVKWPEVPKESVYRKGMKPKEYWEALCKAEAGEFVYRTVTNVDGFLHIRPRGEETDYATQDRYVLEDAYGFREFQFVNLLQRPGEGLFMLSKNNYRFIESGTTSSEGQRWLRHEIDTDKLSALIQARPQKWREHQFSNVKNVSDLRSKYGIVWRGIRRERDAESGVSGGELAVVDLRSGEIVALRRGFALDVFAEKGEATRRYWLSSSGCPSNKRESLTFNAFVHKALPPAGL